ncbi:hypothetical protein [Herbidospora cretacea]|uniref:hypothetical protein n=1 Tax=Herbidospora cretacea TaxID=28444 RepID=UPI0004C3C933|nr:hypothetical protein [Herbidospora cretacea]
MRIIATALAALTLSMALAGPVSAASGDTPSGLAGESPVDVSVLANRITDLESSLNAFTPVLSGLLNALPGGLGEVTGG